MEMPFWGGGTESSPPLERGPDSVTSFQRTENGWEEQNLTEEVPGAHTWTR